MKKQIALLVSLVVVLAVGVVSLVPMLAGDDLPWNRQLYDTKIYCTATLDDDFADDLVMVTLTRQASFGNKAYTTKDFGDIDAKSVEDLTAQTYKNVQKQMRGETTSIQAKLDTDNFRKILEVRLNEACKENVLGTIKKLEVRDDIRYVGPAFVETLFAVPANTKYSEEQWGLDRINVSAAWNITTGDPNNKVRVGVIDSGIDADHPGLTNQVNRNFSRDFTLPYPYIPDAVIDSDGHGTAVAGVIGAEWKSGGVSGVCRDIEMVSLKTGDERCELAAVVRAIIHASNYSIPILNYSAGGLQTAMEPIGQALLNYPGLFVAAVGNDGTDNDVKPVYPANYSQTFDNVVSVSGTMDANDSIKYRGFVSNMAFNHGATTVSIFAPGRDIYTTTLGGKYKSASGTSLAAPFVTGVAALIKSKYPSLTPAQIKRAIINGADKIPALEGLCVTGGRLNAFGALNAAATAPASSSVYLSTVGNVTYEIFNGNYAKVIGFEGSPKIVNIAEKVGNPAVFVRHIGASAFEGCKTLTEVTIPASVTTIGTNAFHGCTGLTKLTIPGSVLTIDNYAFAGTGLTGKLTIPGSVQTIGQGAFGHTNISQLDLSEGLKTIGIAAFMHCVNLKETSGFHLPQTVAIPSSVTGLGMNAFWGTKITGLWMHGKPPQILFYYGSSGTGSNPAGFPDSMIKPALRIIVPAAEFETYKKAVCWSAYYKGAFGEGIYANNDPRLKAA